MNNTELMSQFYCREDELRIKLKFFNLTRRRLMWVQMGYPTGVCGVRSQHLHETNS